MAGERVASVAAARSDSPRGRAAWRHPWVARCSYREGMSTPVWLLVALVAVVVAGTATVVLLRRANRRRPLTREEKLAAAAAAVRQLRRSGPRPHRDTFERGAHPPDRYSAAFLENSAYGDAAGHGGGSGGDGSGSY
ncbi:hypothetical protein GA0070624_5606 [Micromonospora rhizosphaerae]|uniref:Uncharacterized protein n=2 Tax=Micromonospora rhizosphaerae TaxID=568872 RepID=A0A1C6T476_9ACTN|nr:hypothetical protein GA0070624_5606 [Micromonospora rhizosphaerae]